MRIKKARHESGNVKGTTLERAAGRKQPFPLPLIPHAPEQCYLLETTPTKMSAGQKGEENSALGLGKIHALRIHTQP